MGYWYVKVTDPGDAKPRWKRFRSAICLAKDLNGVAVTREEAQEILDELIQGRVTTVNRNPNRLPSLEEFVQTKFMPRTNRKCKRKTREHYRTLLKNHILPTLGKLPLVHITMDHVEQLIQKLMQKTNPRTQKPYGTKILLEVKVLVGTIFNFARKVGWYHGDSPTLGIELPEMDYKERVAFTKDQFVTLVTALSSPAREMILVLAFTGLRIGELLGLRWKRVNLTDEPVIVGGRALPPRAVLVVEQYVRVGREQETFVCPETGKKRKRPKNPDEAYGQFQTLKGRNRGGRIIPLVDAVVEALQEVRDQRKEFLGPDDPVFAGKNGRPLDGHNLLQRKVGPALKELGLPNVGWHSFRHTANAWAECAGATLTDRKKMFGWRRDEMSEVYGHGDVEAMRRAMEEAAAGMKFKTTDIYRHDGNMDPETMRKWAEWLKFDGGGKVN